MNYAYWLATVPGVSDRIKRQLICRVGSAEEIYFLEERQLAAIEELKPEHVARIVAGRKRLWEENYDAMCAQGITFLSLEDPSYPQKLKNIPDPPYGIYIKGPLPKPGDKNSRDRGSAHVLGVWQSSCRGAGTQAGNAGNLCRARHGAGELILPVIRVCYRLVELPVRCSAAAWMSVIRSRTAACMSRFWSAGVSCPNIRRELSRFRHIFRREIVS